jgi:hypothetical protein
VEVVMTNCEGCGKKPTMKSPLAPVRAETGDEFQLCLACRMRVRRMDADHHELTVYRGPVKETRMRIFPTGQSAVFETIAIDHRRARRGG